MAKFDEEAKDLIAIILNYRKAYPNGARMFEIEINERLAELMDMSRTDLEI